VSLDYDDVETYLQSGNVMFETPKTDEEVLRDDIHDAIEDAFGYDITVMIRTRTELQDIVTGQPFDVPTEDAIKHYVTFLHEEPTDEQVEAFYVLDGTLHVETPDETYVVESDHVLFVDPGSPQRAFNPDTAETATRILAIGAPSVDDAHPYEPTDDA
jgi:uncharacterized protein (DUF1697 family)